MSRHNTYCFDVCVWCFVFHVQIVEGVSAIPRTTTQQKRGGERMKRKIVTLVFSLLLLPGLVGAAEVYRDGDKSLSLGWWGQGWYQYIEDGKISSPGAYKDLNDFQFRRSYFYIDGTVTPWFSFFAHLAGDRLGQEGLDNSSNGLGSGYAFRDGWVNIKLHEAFMVQLGRMYVPFTRNYGTTSTKALLTTDLDFTQGGVRGGIFYPSRVGRDDGVTLWGNIAGGLLQYRLMAGDGSSNSDDDLRYAGRLSLSLWDPETGWFNQGTYLGKKKVLSLGVGGDCQKDLNGEQDYSAWTADVHLDLPMGGGSALTVEAAYIDINNSANSVALGDTDALDRTTRAGYTDLHAGDDAAITSLMAGYLLPGNIGPGQLMPFVHGEYVRVEDPDDTTVDREDTRIYGFGANYYILGHANKVSIDCSWVDQINEKPGLEDHFILTFQLAAGF
jgi:hypothetical protein